MLKPRLASPPGFSLLSAGNISVPHHSWLQEGTLKPKCHSLPQMTAVRIQGDCRRHFHRPLKERTEAEGQASPKRTFSEPQLGSPEPLVSHQLSPSSLFSKGYLMLFGATIYPAPENNYLYLNQ